MNINLQGISSIHKKRTENSKFIKYRNIFKVVARVLRKLNLNDLDKLNANITKNLLWLESDDDAFAKEQSEILFDIINQIVSENEFDVNLIYERHQPIVEVYKDVYNDIIENEVNDDLVINDELKNTYIDVDTPYKTPLSSDDLKTLLDNMYSILLLQQLEDKE